MRHISLTRSAVGIGIAAVALAALSVPTAASAAPLDAIDSVTIVSPNPADPTAPLTVGDNFTLNAEWSVSDDAQPGDTFNLTFPSPISVAWAQNFDLRDPDGLVVGSCKATGQTIDCTLGDYVLTHDAVHGSLSVNATASESTDSEKLTFQTSGNTTITAPVPGGGIIDQGPSEGPDKIRKFGGMTSDGSAARWAIEVPVSHLKALGNGVVLTDTYDERLTLDPSTVSIAYVAPDGWNDWIADGTAESIPRSSGEWTFTDSPATHSFDITFPTPRDGGWYLISYSTPIPEDAATGDVFGNEVSAAGTKLTESTVTYTRAGGNGSGSRERSLALKKIVVGPGVAPDATFVVRVSCVKTDGSLVAGHPVDKQIRHGETVTVDKLPVGATCTMSEPQSGGADSIDFSPAPVMTIEAESPTVIDVTVTNTFAVDPTPTPTPTPPVTDPSPEPSATPPAPAAPTRPSTGGLAVTGSADPGIAIGGAGALLALGLAVMLVARRRATH